MELRWLTAFVAVAEELNYRRAAQRLFVAQPAISQQIMNLEKDLGVRLFDRNNRSVRLTDAGAAFLATLPVALGAVENAGLSGAQRRHGRIRQDQSSASTPASRPTISSRWCRCSGGSTPTSSWRSTTPGEPRTS